MSYDKHQRETKSYIQQVLAVRKPLNKDANNELQRANRPGDWHSISFESAVVFVVGVNELITITNRPILRCLWPEWATVGKKA